MACAPTPAYKMRKFIKRNLKPLATAAAFVCLLCVASGISVCLAINENAQRKLVDEERARTEKQREEAVSARIDAERHLYNARIVLARQHWERGFVRRTRDLLHDYYASNVFDPREWEWYYLLSLLSQETNSIEAHSGEIYAVSWKNEELVATAGQDGMIRTWSPTAARQHSELDCQGTLARALDWSRDRLAAGCDDGVVRIWNTGDNATPTHLRLHDARINCVAWSPDGTLIVSGDMNGTLKVYDVNQRQEIKRLDVELPVYSIDWTPDGGQIAVGYGSQGARHDLTIWDTSNWSKKLRGDYAIDKPIKSLAWGPEGKTIALAGEYGVLRTLDATSDRMRDAFRDTTDIASVDWDRTNNLIVAGGGGNTVRVYDIANNNVVANLWGHEAPLTAVAWSVEGKWIASADVRGALKLWEGTSFDEAKTIRRFENYVSRLCWNKDGKRIAVAELLPSVTVWDTSGDNRDLKSSQADGRVWCVAWSPNGELLASDGTEGTIRIHDSNGNKVSVLRGCSGHVFDIAWSPNGRMLAAVTFNETIFWNIATKEIITNQPGPECWTTKGLSWSPDGSLVAWPINKGRDIQVWDVVKQKERVILPFGDKDASCVAWSPDHDRLAAGGVRGELKIWNVSSWEEVSLQGHDSRLAAISWHPSGTRLATVGWDGTAKVREAETGEEVLVFRGQMGRINTVDWSPDGRKLAIGTWDGWDRNVIKIWDAASAYTAMAEDRAM